MTDHAADSATQKCKIQFTYDAQKDLSLLTAGRDRSEHKEAEGISDTWFPISSAAAPDGNRREKVHATAAAGNQRSAST